MAERYGKVPGIVLQAAAMPTTVQKGVENTVTLPQVPLGPRFVRNSGK